ncbi:GNAT family N-acetyltransferase [candidate division KSB1 bacterium]
MEIRYSTELPDKDQFFLLFETTGWNEEYLITKEELFEAAKNSWYTVSAYNEDKLVGFGRMISDGILHSLIIDLIVSPSCKRKGIGSEILKILVEKCRTNQVRDIQLFCARDVEEFYLKHGFVKRPDNAPGMELKK